MALKNILPSKKEESKEYYWALPIEPGWVQAGVWTIDEDQTQVLSVSPPTPWELDENLINAADTALSAAVQDFPEEAKEPSKTVFGVISSWVREGQIEEGYLEKIKKICSKLSLNPVGFVILPEAIAHLIKTEEGSPLSAVVLGIYKDSIEITIFKLGKLLGSSQVARSLSVVDDVVEGLTRFGQSDPFPSRLIIYDGKEGELDEIRQTLLKVNWDDYSNLKFLHTPKIESVSPDRKVHAVALAGASELTDIKTIQVAGKRQEKMEEEVVKKVETLAPQEPVSPQELGFVVGKDIATQAGFEDKPKEVRKDVQKKPEEPAKPKVKEVPKEARGIKFLTNKYLLAIRSVLEKSPNPFKKVKEIIPGAVLGRKAFIIGGVFLILLIVLGFLFWWFYPKAAVIIYVSPKKLDEKVNLVIDPNIEEADSVGGILPGEVLETSVSGEKTRSTTGTKTVGERAKGEVTLYRVGAQLTLPAATKLFGPSSLEFTLDEGVTLASGSAGSPGTTKSNITAVDIGAQYNLAEGATFSVGNYSTSDMEAKNESAFSGGSSREISAVSEEDQEVLEDELTEELTGQAKNELLEDISSDKFFIEESISVDPSTKNFSGKVGDEASTLKLTLTLEIQALVVDRKDLTELAANVLKNRIPEGFVLRDDQIDVEFEYNDEDEGKYKLDAFVEANLLPAIDPGEIAKKIVGKYPTFVEDYFINEIPGFVRAEIDFNKPRFPGRLGTLPRRFSNLEVIISAER